MKKILLIIAAAMISIAANAQFYIGGSASFYQTRYESEKSVLSLQPEFGYNINEKFAVGTTLDFTLSVDNSTRFGLSPYFRWNFGAIEPCKFFVDARFLFTHYNYKDDAKTDGNTMFVGLRPGVSYALNDKLSVVAHLGRFGYYINPNDIGYYKGFYLSLWNDLSLGMYFNF